MKHIKTESKQEQNQRQKWQFFVNEQLLKLKNSLDVGLRCSGRKAIFSRRDLLPCSQQTFITVRIFRSTL